IVFETFCFFFFFSSRRRHTRFDCDWSSDVCSSDLGQRSAGLLLVLAHRSSGKPIFIALRTISIVSAARSRALRLPSRRTSQTIEIGRASCRERVEIPVGGG